MFTLQEEEQIIQLNQQLSQDITISLVSTEQDPGKLFQEFCDENAFIVSKKIELLLKEELKKNDKKTG